MDKVEYTGQEWRNIGHARWRDSLAPLELTQSPEFRDAVLKEDTIWRKAIQPLQSEVQTWKRLFERFQTSAYPEIKAYTYIYCKWFDKHICIQPGAAGYTYNVWITTDTGNTLWSRKGLSGIKWSETSPYFCILQDIGQGSETLELSCYTWTSGPQLLWKKSPVGPNVLFHNSHIYYLGVENSLRYHEIWKTDIATGKKSELLFSEPDKRIQIQIEKKGSTLFVHSANAIFQRLGILNPKTDKLSWITPTIKSTLIAASSEWIASDRKLQSIHSHTVITLPTKEHCMDVMPAPNNALFVTTVNEGKTSLWLFWKHQWICLLKGESLCDIELVHFPTIFPTITLLRPNKPKTVFEFRSGVGLVQTLQFPEPLTLHLVAEGLAGPNKVPYSVVSHVPHPKKLLVDAYGAYGISSRRSYPIRWLPYLEKGYAMAYVCPRGGREKGDPWYDGGRTALRKHHTFEDTAAGIQEIQTRLAISPKSTLFFGRSAGGWLAAQIAQSYGHLVAGVYAEVPYVDVLRTTTNPELPLTQLEYDEFGDPLHRPAEFKALKKISPVDTVPKCRGSCPLVVARTGLNDMQVLPYEPVKWATRLREKGWRRVFVGIDHGGGHFAAAKDMNTQRAEDAALLDAATGSKRPLRARTRRSGRRSHAGSVTRRR